MACHASTAAALIAAEYLDKVLKDQSSDGQISDAEQIPVGQFLAMVRVGASISLGRGGISYENLSALRLHDLMVGEGYHCDNPAKSGSLSVTVPNDFQM